MDNMIKEFLLGLGFQVDESSRKQFNQAIKEATLKVTALYGSIKIMAAGIAYAFTQISTGFEEMGYQYRIIAPAINKELYLRQQLLHAYKAAGVNIRQAIVDSIKLNLATAKTKFLLEGIYKSVAAKFFPLMTKQLEIFRKMLLTNMPKIKSTLEGFVKIVFKAFEVTVQFTTRLWSILTRLYDAFKSLHEATNGWSTAILAVAAAFSVLNVKALLSPLGLLFMAVVALVTLWDDYQTFLEGGDSLFNWSEAIPYITAVTDAIGALVAMIISLFKLDFDVFFEALKGALIAIANVIAKIQSMIFGGISKINDWILENLMNTFSLPSLDDMTTSKLGTQGGNKTSQVVNQQTQITVQGSADASSVGKSVASQQTNVNRDLVRNFSAVPQ